MKRLYIFLILLFLIGCGSNKKRGTDEQNSGSNSTTNSTTTITDNNSSPTISTNDLVNDSSVQKIGKAQLGVISNGTVKIYKLSGANRELLATEKTTVGERIDEIGNFNLNIEKLDDNRYYLYTVSGGEDYDIEDDGIINSIPKSNQGVFHLIAKGSTIKQANSLYITIVSEIVYQKVLPYINGDIGDRLNSISTDIINRDITGDGTIDISDIIGYNPIKNRDNLNRYYKDNLFSMITNILNGQKYDFEDTTYSYIPTTEAEIQKRLDSGDYAYVINQLLYNRDAYSDMSDNEVNMNIASAYIGQSGYTVFDITSAMANSDSNHSLNRFVLDTTKDNNPLSTLENLEKAQDYYSNVINGIDCKDTNITQEQKDSCFDLGLVKLTYLSNSVKMLFHSDENLVKNWANGVEINSTDDLNGNSVPDKSDSSACAIVYANNPMDNCRDGSMSTYRKRVTFNRFGKEYNLTMIDVDVGNSALGFSTFNELVTHKDSNNSAILTDGICDLNFNKTTTHNIDGVTYFPCPVIDNSGKIMNIADSLSNSANIQNLFPSGSDAKITAENYIKNITGSKDGVIDQNNLSSYLQSH